MKDGAAKFSLKELAALTGVNRRSIRFYIQNGLVDRPEGQARGAYYTRKHLEQILEIGKLQRAGMTLEGIRRIFQREQDEALPSNHLMGARSSVEVWSRLTLADGLEVHIHPETAGLTPEQLREFSLNLVDLVKDLKERGKE